MTLDTLIFIIMGIVTAVGLGFGCVAVVRSMRSPDLSLVAENANEIAGQSDRFFKLPNPRSRIWIIFAMGMLSLWLSSEYWATSKSKEANEIHQQELEKGNEAVQAAYEAAALPHLPEPSLKKQGYVYLGQCDKQQWVPKTFLFGNLPRCNEELSPDGRKILSWKGAVIRTTPPTKTDGKTHFGSEVARVSAGYSVVLRKMFPVSVFSSGPRYYWGLVDLPDEKPSER